ncbi:MAG: glycosyltransferase family 4 protein [Pseudomonadales bacterium]|nr:glycosyltransferase family 4 protein [Pseudomonadales bacterium]
MSAFVVVVLTGLVRHYALTRNIIDIPGQRSSHAIPTPRGGGVAILAGLFLGLPGLVWQGSADGAWLWWLLPPAFAVAAIGWWDDHHHVPARWRLLVHFSAVIWLVAGLAPPSSLLAWGQGLVAVVALVWFLNLYNFMDGIDALAASEAVFLCCGIGLLGLLSGAPELALVAFLVGFCVGGFLPWNAPPARLFLGDVGSGLLGLVLGALLLRELDLGVPLFGQSLFWACLILPAVFATDASLTLARRVLAGKPPHVAHRSHAYQYASRRFGGHRPVVVAVLVINFVWLLPLAAAVQLQWLTGPVALALAYVPLLVLAWLLKAGNEVAQEMPEAP